MIRFVFFLLCYLSIQIFAQNPATTAATAASTRTRAADVSPREKKQSELGQDNLAVARGNLRDDQATPARESWKDWSAVAQAIITTLSILIVGWWTFVRFGWAQERYPNIEFTADINVLGVHQAWMIVELIAYIENKGRVQHKMTQFKFWLNALLDEDTVEVDTRWGGQVNFPQAIAEGSFLPANFGYFFIDPGTKAKYSWVARVPIQARFLLLHCRFEYEGRGHTEHTAEKSIKVPENL